MDQDAVQGQQRASKEIKRILSEDGMKTKSVLSTLSGIGKSLKRTVLPSGRSRSNSLVLGMPFNASSVEPSPNISLDGKEPIVFGSFPSHKGESKDDRGNYIFPPGIGAIPWQPLRDANS